MATRVTVDSAMKETMCVATGVATRVGAKAPFGVKIVAREEDEIDDDCTDQRET